MGYIPAPLKALIGIASVLLVGTLGYRLVEGWSFIDSFYMTVITLTTIGYGEVHPLTTHGRFFTVGLIFVGLGMVYYALMEGARFVVEGEINELITRRRFMKAIERIENHIIVCGFGRMGSHICHQLDARGIPFVLVEEDLDVLAKATGQGFLTVQGDATEEETLRKGGVERAKALVAVVDTDAENLYTVLTTKEINPGIEIIARAAEESAHKKLIRAGADKVISPYQIGATRVLMSIIKPTVVGFLEVVMDQKELNVELEEVEVAESSAYVGKALVETDIRRELNLIIIAIKKGDGTMVFNPGPDTVVDSGDTLIAMGHPDMLALVKQRAGSTRWW